MDLRVHGAKAAKPAVLVALVAFLAVAIAFQGWRSRGLLGVERDLVTPAQSAYDFIHAGKVPDHAGVSSTLAFLPPGTNWLLVPGVALFRDPRLYQVPASAMLFALTLVGILLLGRLLAGPACGWLAVALYASSWIGLFFATSLWPRGHPFFVVWVLYFCVLAVQRSNRLFFAAALVLYALGMYVFLEIAPLGFVFVLAGFLNRTLLTWPPLLGSSAIAALVWMPYLHFEAGRNFVDLGVLARGRPPALVPPQWWPPTHPLRAYSSGELLDPAKLDLSWPPLPRFESVPQKLVNYTAPNFVRSFYSNTDATSLGESGRLAALVSSFVFVFVLCGALLLGASAMRRDTNTLRRALVVSAGVVFVLAIAANASALLSIGNNALTQSGKDAFADIRYPLAFTLGWLLITLLVLVRAGRDDAAGPIGTGTVASRIPALFVMCALVAGQIFWGILAGAEGRRFLWLWPLECLLIAYAALWLAALPAIRPLRSIQRPLLVALVLLAVLKNDTVIDRLTSWRGGSWAGRDADFVGVLDSLAHDARSRHPAEPVSVSYDLVLKPAGITMGMIDPAYNNAMSFDQYLLRAHGLRNTVTGVDTFDARSEYLVREEPATPTANFGMGALYFERPVDLSRTYRLLMKSGNVSLYAQR